MLNIWNNLPPFVQRILSGVITAAITLGLAALAAAGIYKPAVINVAAPNVTVQYPSGETVKAVPATAPK
jgi:hypothetical protein